MRCKECGQELPPPPPRRPSRAWKVGDRVEYIRDMEWACEKGTRGIIVQQDERRDIPNDPNDYQVFWVSPVNEAWELEKRPPVWWTTPADVKYAGE